MKSISVKLWVVVISFIGGIALTKIFTRPKKTVYKFPTPHNLNTIYNSEGGDCFRFKKSTTECNEYSLDHPVPTANGV